MYVTVSNNKHILFRYSKLLQTFTRVSPSFTLARYKNTRRTPKITQKNTTKNTNKSTPKQIVKTLTKMHLEALPKNTSRRTTKNIVETIPKNQV